MHVRTLVLVCLSVFVVFESSAQVATIPAADSLPNHGSFHLWLDGGFYPFRYHYSGGFEPTFNLRFGIGKTLQWIQIYGFLEVTEHQFDSPDAISSSSTSDKRQDIAIYASACIWRILILGAGFYHTHQDNIVTRYRFSDIITNSGVQSHFGFYYLLGVNYQIQVADSFSIPVGLYYRDQENPRNTFPAYQMSLRLGVIYSL
jgi:hypothetical protein